MGLLPGRVVKNRYRNRKVTEGMLSREEVYTIKQSEVGDDPIAKADQFFSDHMGIHKLLVVDEEDKLEGLIHIEDIERITGEVGIQLKPARDENFKLLCGAAVSIPKEENGQIDSNSLLNHGELIDKGLNLEVISTAHGHTRAVGEATKYLSEEFKEITIMSGNVTSGEGVEFLEDAGAQIVKVGQGPGSICTTRIVAGVGTPQMSALYAANTKANLKNINNC